MIRLNKYLADTGFCSRRQADQYIKAGLISVNGKSAKLGQQVDGKKDIVQFKKQKIQAVKKLVYYAIYKPKGALSTTKDRFHRQTVVDLAPKDIRVYPVGRLDNNSEGLMILTNDGDLANVLTHPRYEHSKEYEILTRYDDRYFRGYEDLKKKMESGISIDSHLLKADHLTNFKRLQNNQILFHLILHTGFYHQIRKMCSTSHLEVLSLKRLRIGKLSLTKLGLRPGQCIEIDKKDIVG